MKIPLLNLKYSSGGTLVADILNALGIEYVFTIAGSQTLPVMHGIPERDINIVVSRSERNSVFMAEGYGKALNFPAVSLSTLGPGIANELPALYSARRNRAPLLSITPFHPSWKRHRLGEVFQGLNHPEFLKNAVKENYIIDEVEKLPDIITYSFRKCLEEPAGPVHIDISFPILFQSNLYFKFQKNHKRMEYGKKLYLVYESPEFIRWGVEEMLLEGQEMVTLSAGDSTGTLPFALGVKFGIKENNVVVFISLDNLLRNLDSIAVAIANSRRPLLISMSERSVIRKIADVFKIEYKSNFSNTFLQKSNTMIIAVD